MKAAIYARCATSRPGDGVIERQLRVCERLSAHNDFTIVGHFIDRDCGANSQRPAYQEVLHAARQHEFDVIVAEDISRFGRGQGQVSSLVAEMDSLGITVLTEQFDSRAKPSNLALLTLESKADSNVRSLRIKRGLEARIKRRENNQ